MSNLFYEQLEKQSDGTYENEIRADERRKTINELEARLLKFKYSDENVCDFISVDSVLIMLEQMKEQKNDR